jgi:hypothetical protein
VLLRVVSVMLQASFLLLFTSFCNKHHVAPR